MTNTELLHEMIVGLVRDAMPETTLYLRMVELTNVDGKYTKLGSMCSDELHEGIAACVAKNSLIEIVYTLPGKSEQRRLFLPSQTRVTMPCPAASN